MQGAAISVEDQAAKAALPSCALLMTTEEHEHYAIHAQATAKDVLTLAYQQFSISDQWKSQLEL
jgi:hypothetical protein